MFELPPFFRVEQRFDAPRVDDVAETVEAQLASLQLADHVQPGASIAITAGSRGIRNIAIIIRAIADHLQSIGTAPFIVPAMGSHGGGTAEGQVELLASYGITSEFCGCPIRSTMDTVQVCQADEGFPVHFDRFAWEADHVVVCGRIKPHTSFVGPIESGLMKMMLIGLGKKNGATVYHRAILNFSFDQIVRSVGREVLNRCNILAGVAIVENQFDETAIIEAVEPSQFERREPELLIESKKLIPRLPFDQADVLIVDQIGKNISGTGMDTNVIGRKFHDHEAADGETPKITRIAVRDLTTATHGNATGIGIAEFCHRRVVEQTDIHATRLNSLTGGHPTAAMFPLDYECDREMLQAALATIGLVDPPDARILWIQDTLHLSQLECSQSFLAEAQARDDLFVLGEPRTIACGDDGDLPWCRDMGFDQ